MMHLTRNAQRQICDDYRTKVSADHHADSDNDDLPAGTASNLEFVARQRQTAIGQRGCCQREKVQFPTFARTNSDPGTPGMVMTMAMRETQATLGR